MGTKAQKSLKRAKQVIRASYKNAMKSRLYTGWNIGNVEPYDVEHNGMTYKVEPQSTRIIDDSDFLSPASDHLESSGYSIITSYTGEKDELDFTFAQPQDEIKIDLGKNIKKVTLNFSNLENAEFSGETHISFNVLLDCGMLETLTALKKFLDNNSEMIQNINFQGIDNKVLKRFVAKACERYGKTVSFNEEKKQEDSFGER